jgi:hypothetical protein
LISKIALLSIDKNHRKSVRFSCIETENDWRELLEFRLINYQNTIPYMLDELDETGADPYDRHSYIFAVWDNHTLIGSIRYTTWPFELSNLLHSNELFGIIPESKRHEYLELSRLLVKPGIKTKGILAALIVYSGLTICLNTKYRMYIGYAKKVILKKFGKFNYSSSQYEFSIPTRKGHLYSVLTGDFEVDFVNAIDRSFPIKLGKFFANIFFSRRANKLEDYAQTLS